MSTTRRTLILLFGAILVPLALISPVYALIAVPVVALVRTALGIVRDRLELGELVSGERRLLVRTRPRTSWDLDGPRSTYQRRRVDQYMLRPALDETFTLAPPKSARATKSTTHSGLPSHRSMFATPADKITLRLALDDPDQHSDWILYQVFEALSSPANVSIEDGALSWSDVDRTYRRHRPSTLGDPNISNTSISRTDNERGTSIVLQQHILLYDEDLIPISFQAPTNPEAEEDVLNFIHDRFATVPSASMHLLADAASAASLSPEMARSLLAEALRVCLGEDFVSTVLTEAYRSERTLKQLIAYCRPFTANELDVHLATTSSTARAARARPTQKDLKIARKLAAVSKSRPPQNPPRPTKAKQQPSSGDSGEAAAE